MRRLSGNNYLKSLVGKNLVRSKTQISLNTTKSFILGQSILGIDKLGLGNDSESSGFILGQSMLGVDKLGENTNTGTQSHFILGQSKLGVDKLN